MSALLALSVGLLAFVFNEYDARRCARRSAERRARARRRARAMMDADASIPTALGVAHAQRALSASARELRALSRTAQR